MPCGALLLEVAVECEDGLLMCAGGIQVTISSVSACNPNSVRPHCYCSHECRPAECHGERVPDDERGRDALCSTVCRPVPAPPPQPVPSARHLVLCGKQLTPLNLSNQAAFQQFLSGFFSLLGLLVM